MCILLPGLDGFNTLAKEKVAKPQAKASKRWTGLKVPPPGLKERIKVANMVPPGTFLPDRLIPLGITSWAEIVGRINRLPAELREDLLARAEAERPKDLAEAWRHLDEDWRDVFRVAQVSERYNKIRSAYWLLRMVSQSEAKSIEPLEELVSILRRADLSYLRQCDYCQQIFYATKSIQPGCTPDHSTKLRKQRKYKKDVERRHPLWRLRQTGPKKRAKTASKR